jgi:hypothetical protein
MGTYTVRSKRTDQPLHDRVIEVVADHVRKLGYLAGTNPGSEHNWAIGGLYPDVIAMDEVSKQVSFIVEIETDDSVTEGESDQWASYASLGHVFYLMVPKARLENAVSVCRRKGIPARFGYYTVGLYGTITIYWV